MANDATDIPANDWPASPHFAGWIPCANGHLSFSLFGKEDHFSTANVSLNGESPTRRIFIAQRRETHDLVIPAWILRHIFRYHRVAADYYFVAETSPAKHPIQCNAKVKKFPDKLGVLSGSIYIVIAQETRELHHERNRLLKRIRRAAEKTQSLYVKQQAQPEANSVFAIFPSMMDEFKSRKAVILEFSVQIYRTGEIRITPIDESFPRGDYKGDADAERDDYILSMASQAYYFAKDAGHRHYHHDRKQDNVLPIATASSTEDEAWRRETMWSLVRAVLNARRRPDIEDFSKAAGISAYAASFQSHLGGHKRCEKSFEEFEHIDVTTEYDLNFLNASLEARREELSWSRSNNLHTFHAAVATVISVFALWLASAQWVSSQDKDFSGWPNWVTAVLRQFTTYPEFIAIIGATIWILFIRINQNKFPFARKLLSTILEILDNTYFSITRALHFLFGSHADRIASLLRIIMYAGGTLFFADLSLSMSGINLWALIRGIIDALI